MSAPTATRKYRALFEPFDAKEWTLPRPVIEARNTATRLAAARVVEPPAPNVALDEAVRAAMVSSDPASVDVSAILGHARMVAEYDSRVEVLRTAADRAAADLNAAVSEHRDKIITEHLRPAGEKLWGEIEKAVRTLGEIEVSDTDALLRAPARVREAWLALDGMAAKYDRIRQAMSRLNQHTNAQPEHDAAGDHAEFRAGLCTVTGPNWRGTNIAATAPKMPWPTDSRGRLVWLVRANARPWWPTIGERDEAWMDTHLEGYEQMRDQQQRHRVAQDWASSLAG